MSPARFLVLMASLAAFTASCVVSTTVAPRPGEWTVTVETESPPPLLSRQTDLLPLDPRWSGAGAADELVALVRESYYEEASAHPGYRVLVPAVREPLLATLGYEGRVDLAGEDAAMLAARIQTEEYLTLELQPSDESTVSLTAVRARAGRWDSPIARVQAAAPPEAGPLSQAVRSLVREAMDLETIEETPAIEEDPPPTVEDAPPPVEETPPLVVDPAPAIVEPPPAVVPEPAEPSLLLAIEVPEGATALAFAPDAAGRLAAGTATGRILFLDGATGEALGAAGPLPGPVAALLYNPFFDLLIAGTSGEGAVVRFWDSAGRTDLGSIAGFSGEADALAISGDGRLLAGCAGDGSLFVFDLVKGDWLHPAIVLPGGARARSLIWTGADEGSRIICADAAGALHELAPLTGSVAAAGADAGGRCLPAPDASGRTRLWTDGRLRDFAAGRGAFRALAVSQDGSRAALADEAGRVEVWRLR